MSKYITPFPGLRETHKLGTSKDDVHFLTQTEFSRRVESLVRLYRHLQICKGIGLSLV